MFERHKTYVDPRTRTLEIHEAGEVEAPGLAIAAMDMANALLEKKGDVRGLAILSEVPKENQDFVAQVILEHEQALG